MIFSFSHNLLPVNIGIISLVLINSTSFYHASIFSVSENEVFSKSFISDILNLKFLKKHVFLPFINKTQGVAGVQPCVLLIILLIYFLINMLFLWRNSVPFLTFNCTISTNFVVIFLFFFNFVFV